MSEFGNLSAAIVAGYGESSYVIKIDGYSSIKGRVKHGDFVKSIPFYGAMKENASSPIEIIDMDSDVFRSLLHFIYTDSLLHGGDAHTDGVMAGHLLVAADRYNIERLKLLCEERLCNLIDSNIVATSLALAEQHSFHRIKEACFEFLTSPSNLDAMIASDGYEHLKNSCPSVLKELAASFLPVELKIIKEIIMTV
ncbi:hypothetical protein ACQ4PT_030680 [Festuca glaucescens]